VLSTFFTQMGEKYPVIQKKENFYQLFKDYFKKKKEV